MPVVETPETGSNGPSGYEAPKIERLMSADDLTREVQYAGSVSVADV